MKREEQLKFCRTCKNKNIDIQKGIICGLTNQTPDFEDICEKYEEDPVLSEKQKSAILINKTANQTKRLLNYLIDLLVTMVIGFFIGSVLNTISPTKYISINKTFMSSYLFSIIFCSIYYSVFEFFTGKTIAKLITGTKVVTNEDERPDFKTVLLRTLCRFIPFEAFSFLNTENKGWHDRLSGTTVIVD